MLGTYFWGHFFGTFFRVCGDRTDHQSWLWLPPGDLLVTDAVASSCCALNNQFESFLLNFLDSSLELNVLQLKTHIRTCPIFTRHDATMLQKCLKNRTLNNILDVAQANSQNAGNSRKNCQIRSVPTLQDILVVSPDWPGFQSAAQLRG